MSAPRVQWSQEWDVGGATMRVSVLGDGVVCRRHDDYSGQSSTWVSYWPSGSTTECWPSKNEGEGYRTAAQARRTRAKVRQ